MAYKMKMKKKPANKKLAAQYGDKTKITRGDIITAAKKNKKKGLIMIILGHTPREWKRRAKEHKWFIGVVIISFVLGGIIL